MITVTKGELSTIMGILDYAKARLKLKESNFILQPIGLPGLAVIEVLDSTFGIDLDNPEVVQLCDILEGNGVITSVAREKIRQYIISKTPIEITPINNLKKYKLDAPEEVKSIVDYSVFVSPWCTFSPTSTGLFIEKIGEFSLDGICNNPNAVEVL